MKWRKSVGLGASAQMVDVAVQGLVHSEHELGHTHFLSLRGTSARRWLRYESVVGESGDYRSARGGHANPNTGRCQVNGRCVAGAKE